jgi:hypothetical protein
MFLSYLVENFFLVILRVRIFCVFEIFYKKYDFKVKFSWPTLASYKSSKLGAGALFFSAFRRKSWYNFKFFDLGHNDHLVDHNDRSKLKVNLKVIKFVWKTHQNDLRGQLSNERIINHRWIMYAHGAREQNTLIWF